MQLAGSNILEVDGLWKRYARSSEASRKRVAAVLSQAVFGRAAQMPELIRTEFWGLQDISLNLRCGEALGVIGLNGSGKTTLLRILNGQLLPDRGEVRVFGPSASLIDLTAGFQEVLSGRQNIYLRGAMLGRSKADLRAREAEIIEFCELGDAIDAPISGYSAGMRMRLAFAISVAVEPELLLIDEVLAVGDFRFRQKCLARMRELRDRCGFVLVSHNMNDIERFCDWAMVLHKGQAVFQGDTNKAVEFYYTLERESSPRKLTQGSRVHGESVHNAAVIESVSHQWTDKSGNPLTVVAPGQTVFMRVRFTLKYVPKQLVVGVPLWTEEGVMVTGFSTEVHCSGIEVKANEPMTLKLEVSRLNLVPGRYHSTIGVLDGAEYIYRQPNPDLQIADLGGRSWGLTTMDYCWHQC